MMKSLKKWNWKKHMEFILIALSTSFLGWMFLSFLNVNMHNMTDHVFADWNFFYCWGMQVEIPHHVFWVLLFATLTVYFAQIAQWNYNHSRITNTDTTAIAPRKCVIKRTYTVKITEHVEI